MRFDLLYDWTGATLKKVCEKKGKKNVGEEKKRKEKKKKYSGKSKMKLFYIPFNLHINIAGYA